MARLVGGPFGGVSGKMGDVVYKNRNGNTIVCARPRERISPLSELEIGLHAKFGLAGKISGAINSIAILKQIWKPTYKNGLSSYNVIFKNNYKIVNIKNIRGPVLIAPVFGFNLTEPSIKVGGAKVVIECEPMDIGSGFDTKAEKFVIAAGVIVLEKPLAERIPSYDVLPFKSLKQTFNPKEALRTVIDITGGPLRLFQSYGLNKVYAVLVTTDETGNPVRYSGTFSSQ
jgi:hypothetical protein